MLLETKLVDVPAQTERDADLNEYGTLSNKVRAAFGNAAMEAGSPDYGTQGDATGDDPTDAVDAIANILHFVSYHGGDVVKVLDGALLHFNAERGAIVPTYAKCESCGSLHPVDTSGGYTCPA